MYNKARLDTILYNTINQLINEGKDRTSRELLLEGDDRLKKVKRIIQQAFSGTSINTDGPVSSAEYYVGNKGANTTWMDYLLYSVRHTFGLMDNKDLPLLVKVAKIAFEELEFEKSEDHIDELNTLKAIVNLLKKDTNAANRVIKDPNVTYEKLYNEYADVLKQLENDMRYRVNSKEYQKNQRYEIMPIDDFRTANELGKYTGRGNGDGALCYTQGENTWNGYTRNGINQCYLCYTTDFKDIEPRVTEGYPKDEYGLSMIWLFVDGNGELTNSNVRWNHGYQDFKDVDNMFTPEEISDIVGVNFYETFRPNDKWAKKVEETLYRLKNGEDPHEVFDFCWGFKEGVAMVQLDGKQNYINTDGELLSPNKWFDWCGNFKEGFATVKVGQKWNYINANAELLSPNRWFDGCNNFEDGFAIVKLNGKYNFINTNGELLSPNKWFDLCGDFKEGFGMVLLGDKRNYINANGKLLSPNQWFDEGRNFSEGVAMVRVDNKWNYINTNGDYLSDTWFDKCWNFKEGFAVVKVGNKLNFINTNGELLNPNIWFDGCLSFKEGFAKVVLNGKCNYINTNGELLSPNIGFDWCDDFNEGFAKVLLNGSWYFINTDGDIINDAVQQLLARGISLDDIFDECGNFYEGFAIVQLSGRCNFINTNGELLSPNKWFDDCGYFYEGFASVKLNDKWYAIDTKGQLYTMDGEPINSPLQENRSYRKRKKHVIRITEAQLRNAINKAIKQI